MTTAQPDVPPPGQEGLLQGEDQTPFQEGFTRKTILGALFVAFIMLPGNIYLGLLIGKDNPAAEWVTVILFLELARRSFTTLKKQEIYVLFYAASILVRVYGGMVLPGGVFASAIWHQYMRQSVVFEQFHLSSTAALPEWVAPSVDVLRMRTFWHEAWVPAFLVLVAGLVLDRMSWLGLGYIAYRITADVERLEFPMAPVAAEGATALAESSQKQESWRWPIFSVGATAGVAFGLFYVAVPAITGAVFPRPVQLLPIPFLDLTEATETLLPAAIVGITLDLGVLMAGFILPWRIIVGIFITSVVAHIVLPPFLHKWGVLTHWSPGYDALATGMANNLDLWLSIGIGCAFAVCLIGIYGLLVASRKADTKRDWSRLWRPAPGRGQMPLWIAIVLFLGASVGYVVLCHGLVNLGWLSKNPAKPHDEWFSWYLFAVFAFFWTPLNTYLAAHMQGITGRPIALPFIREATFLLSPYSKPDVWFAPIPLHNYGGSAQFFRVVELTRTRFYSILKVEALIHPLLLVSGFLFWWYIWSLGDIPSERYPYVQRFWPINATMSALWATALSDGTRFMLDAIKPALIIGAVVIGVLAYLVFSLLGINTGYFYGVISGFGTMPHYSIPMFIGMLISRFYLAKRIGPERWRRYTPVVMAGFSCGTGLVAMLSIAVVFLSKAVTPLPY